MLNVCANEGNIIFQKKRMATLEQCKMEISMAAEEEEEDIMLYILLNKKKTNKRRWWVHPINKKREQLGAYSRLVMELNLDSQRFSQFFRLSKEQFHQLLCYVGPRIAKITTKLRQPICPQQRLAICLR